MGQIMLNAAIGALEIDGFEGQASRHDDRVLESVGLGIEPQPFTQIGFPPPCNVSDDDVMGLAGR